MKMPNRFEAVSDEIVFIILDFIHENPVDRKAFSLVCRSFYSLERRHRKSLKPLRSDHLRKVLERYPYASSLDLSSCPGITDDSLSAIAGGCGKERLKSINLSRFKFFSHVGLLKLVRNCGNLVEVDLSNAAELKDMGAAAIGEAKNLEKLWLVGCKGMSDMGLSCIAVGCKKLKLLSLKWCLGVSDLGVGIVAVKCKDLRCLDLSFLQITSKCLPEIFKLEHLEDLVLEGCFGLDDDLAEVKHCKSLQKIDISKCLNVSEMGLFSLAAAAGGLRQLILSYGFCVDIALANSLHKFSTLTSIKFDGCEITCSGLKSIGQWCGSLRELSLRKCLGVTDEGLAHVVTKHKELRKLDITCCRKITRFSLTSITNSCTFLTCLKMESCTSVAADAFVSIGQHCPFLEELDLTDSEIDDEGLKSISKCSRLSILKLGICLNITDEGLVQVGMCCSKMKELDLYRSAGITDLGILAISRGCPNLEMVNTAYCKLITDNSLMALSKCRKLNTVEIGGCSLVTSSGLAAVAKGCRQLYKLDIKKCCNVCDSGVITLARFSQNLNQINLSYTSVSDVGLLSLASISGLQSISMVQLEGLTASGLAAALLACGGLARVKLHTSMKPLFPQRLIEHLGARGCVFHWVDGAFKPRVFERSKRIKYHPV